MAAIELVNITKSFGPKTVIQDISLDVQDGEFLVLLGPSGCGKSTLLRMLAGLETVSGGEIRLGGRRVDQLPPSDRDMAFVFQSYALYPHMTVRRNITFPLIMRRFRWWFHIPLLGGLGKRRIEKLPEVSDRVDRTAKILGLTDMLDRHPRTLSGGQRQRVALGRAMVREPEVFLMDEPLSNLDAKLRTTMRAEITKLHREVGGTFVYVTHDQVEAMTMGTRIAVMSDGLLQQVGTPQALYDKPINRFVAGFIGSPAMNFVDVTMDGAEGSPMLKGEGGAINIPLPPRLRESVGPTKDRKLVAGFRPEHIEIGEAGQNTATFRANADVVEYLGNEELLHVNAGGRDIVAIVDSEHRVKPGDVLDFHIPIDKLHLFDGEGGQSLTSREVAAAAS
jgi:multiple sugar transport system ATP-binding protein